MRLFDGDHYLGHSPEYAWDISPKCATSSWEMLSVIHNIEYGYTLIEHMNPFINQFQVKHVTDISIHHTIWS